MSEQPSTGAGAVTREVDLDLDPEELWELVGDGERWEGWLAPEVDVQVAPGGGGRVVDDDGVTRRVVVDDVAPGRSVRFTWWPDGDDEQRSTVELVVLARPDGSRLVVTEVLGVRASALGVRRAWACRLGVVVASTPDRTVALLAA